MSGRNFAAHQLLMAEDEMLALSFLADEVGVDLGVLSDSIHWDDAQPPAVDGLLALIEGMRKHVDRAAGLVRAYELHRRSQMMIREVRHDNASARTER